MGAQPAAAAVAESSGETMGASLSQDVAYLPDEVINNYRRSDDRDLRFRLALASHQRFYKHFDPAKLVLNEDEFHEVFSPSFVDARLHFRHLDEKERGRVSSFEALAVTFVPAATSRTWPGPVACRCPTPRTPWPTTAAPSAA